MAEIEAAVVQVYFLFEVAESISLERARELLGPQSAQAQIAYKHGAPSYLRFQNPPVTVGADPLDCCGRPWQSRIKIYDYGVASMTLTTPFQGSWRDLSELCASVIANPEMESAVAQAMSDRLSRLEAALTKAARRRIVEDYVIVALSALDTPRNGTDLLRQRGPEIAQILRGERTVLSEQETREILSSAMSYEPADLLVVAWNAALILDSPGGAEATAEILEYVNSQLLEFRYYDELLDAELSAAYDELESSRAATWFRFRRWRNTARRLNALYLEVSELAEKSENALKFFGDLFASRVYRLGAQRLGLNEWKQLVDGKLHSASELYHSLIDEVSSSRMQFMEAAIVFILVFELALAFAGILK